MRGTFALFGLISMSPLAGGCTTLTTGGFQTVSVNTQPEGADCRFSRDGIVVARVNPTPGSIVIGKAHSGISVVCTKSGYQDAVQTTASEFQPMTLGNVILGGVFGLVVDAATGAMTKHPEAVTLVLTPQEFQTAADRDRFFAPT